MKNIRLTGLTLVGLCIAGGAMANEELEPCGAAQMEEYIGQSLETANGVFPDTARIIPANSAVAQDFRADWVNVVLDEDEIIVRIWCG
jgi:hypothetical protein